MKDRDHDEIEIDDASMDDALKAGGAAAVAARLYATGLFETATKWFKDEHRREETHGIPALSLFAGFVGNILGLAMNDMVQTIGHKDVGEKLMKVVAINLNEFLKRHAGADPGIGSPNLESKDGDLALDLPLLEEVATKDKTLARLLATGVPDAMRRWATTEVETAKRDDPDSVPRVMFRVLESIQLIADSVAIPLMVAHARDRQSFFDMLEMRTNEDLRARLKIAHNAADRRDAAVKAAAGQ